MRDSGARRIDDPSDDPTYKVDMKFLIRALVKYGASDLHIKVGRPPLYRINGRLVAAKMESLTSDDVRHIIHGILLQRQIDAVESKRQIDFSFHMKDHGRFRCNVYFQRGTLSAAVRAIPFTAPSIEELGVPLVAKDLCLRPRGLIIVTGPTGSGKSTTLASLIQHINISRHAHVLTIEDPIEFLFRDERSSVTQREIGSDAHSMNEALIAGLRQDPDVIMLGEVRDKESIMSAVTAAETGHLVLTTMHTRDARSSLERILDVFPGDMQNQVRVQLANSLHAVISQQLISRADGNGRVLASEVMIKSPAIEQCILANQFEKIPDLIAQSNTYYKMQSFNQHLERLVVEGVITVEDALRASVNPEDLRLRVSGIRREDGYLTAKVTADD